MRSSRPSKRLVRKFSHGIGRKLARSNQRSPNGHGPERLQSRVAPLRRLWKAIIRPWCNWIFYPKSPGRDHRELELLQSVVWTLYVTKSHGSPETIAATERAAVLAERGGSLSQLVISLFSRGLARLMGGDLLTGLALEDQALVLALRDSNPAHLGVVRVHQMLARNWVGDLVGVEDQFSAGLEFFKNADFRRFPGATVGGFGFASLNAWTRGYSEVALQREAEMRSAANENNPYDMALAQGIAGYIQIYCGKLTGTGSCAGSARDI